MTDTFTEDEVEIMIEAMRIRGELRFESEKDLRLACEVMTREELVDIISAYHWRNSPTEKH